MNTSFKWIFTLLFGLLLSGNALAQGAGAIRERMKERLPKIDAMKQAGDLGEDNQGYLSVRKASADAEALAAGENADRKAVYQAIAGKEGTTAEKVGQLRARQIAGRASPGTWIQAADGTWARK